MVKDLNLLLRKHSRVFNNSEASASELLENHEEMIHRYWLQ